MRYFTLFGLLFLGFVLLSFGAFPFSAHAAQIKGTIIDPDGIPVKGIDSNEIGVFAYQRGGIWKEGVYDPQTGGYVVDGLTLGEWYITTEIYGEYTGFLDATIANPILLANQTMEQNIQLRRVAGVLSGNVLDASGSPIAKALVNITNKISGEVFSGETNTEGLYHLIATKGLYSLRAFFDTQKNIVTPKEVDEINLDDGALAKISFIFSKPQTSIEGRVFAGPFAVPVGGALIYAWSDKGRSTETTASVDGVYKLNIDSEDDVWHLYAMKQINNNIYSSKEITFTWSGNTGTYQPLTFTNKETLPEAITKTFSSSESATIKLPDGMALSLPAYAVPSESFTITIKPSVARLQKGVFIQSKQYNVSIHDSSGKSVPVLEKGAVLELPYTASLVDNGLHLFFWNSLARAWQSNGNSVTDPNHKSVIGLVNYLAGFIVGSPQVQSVTPTNGGGSGAGSSSPPTAASNFAAFAQNSSSVFLSWIDPIIESGERRTIERSQGSGLSANSGFIIIADTANNTLSISQTGFTDSGLNNNTEYCYRSRSFTDNGSAVSLVQCVTTPPAPPDTTPPIIGNLLAQITDATNGLALVSWTTNEPTSSNISCSVNGQSLVNAAQPNFILFHSFPFIGQSGGQYLCTINVSDSSGNVSSGSINVTIPTLQPVTPPVVPTTPETTTPTTPTTGITTLPASLIGSPLLLRNLNVGSTGSDVQTFQRVLNALPCCRVATSGPGSPGNETLFYGPLTTDAVHRFQQTYIPEILAIQGIPEGTDNLGPFTRGIINSFLQGGDITP